MSKRRNHDAGFKARVALEAVKGERNVSELAAEYGVHPTMSHQWKKALLEGASDIFERGGKKKAEVDGETVRSLHTKIGELAVANDFVTKAQALNRQVGRGMIERSHPTLSVGEQCRLLSISRSSFYYTPQGETAVNMALMQLIDRQFLETPFYGVQQMTWHLQNEGHAVNVKRIRRLGPRSPTTVGAILPWGFAPPQAVAIDEDNATQSTSIINSGLAMRLRKVRLQTCHLCVAQPEKIRHGHHSFSNGESCTPNQINGP